MKKDLIEDALTYKIIGCAMKVHNTLGSGFQEVIYQRALDISLRKTDLLFSREPEIPIYYEGTEIGRRRVDFLVNDEILIELKAVSKLDDIHLAQALNYLSAYNLDKGLLINFGGTNLEIKRIRHPGNRRIGVN